MIAVKIGTTSWRATETLAVDEVEFTGRFLYEADGFTPAMVWDASINNVRARNAAETLEVAKLKRIEADRQECQRRIYQYWPLQEQVTALAGNYEPGGMDSLAAWQASNIAASNVARDQINAAATVAAVEAVTVSWPVWNG